MVGQKKKNSYWAGINLFLKIDLKKVPIQRE